MPSFISNRTPSITTTVSEKTEVQMCPSCTFPNYGNARQCADCGYPLEDGNIRWLRASLVSQCNTPGCGAFFYTRDKSCRNCGRNTSESTNISNPPHPRLDSEVIFVLPCPECHINNPANAAICSGCGYSLEDIDPVCHDESDFDSFQDESIFVQIENIRTRKKVTINLAPGERVIVGSDALLSDQLMNTGYVSHEHLTLVYRNDTLWIIDESRNGTYIDGVRLDTKMEIPLFNNTIVGLGDPSVKELKAAFFKITY